MKLKAAITATAPPELFDALGSVDFAIDFMADVVGTIFDVGGAALRPAEFYVQYPDRTIPAGRLGPIDPWGVEVRLTGVSRGNRPANVFHQALDVLTDLVESTVRQTLPIGKRAQVFVVIMLTGDIETAPGSGVYSSVLESDPEWIGGEREDDESDGNPTPEILETT